MPPKKRAPATAPVSDEPQIPPSPEMPEGEEEVGEEEEEVGEEEEEEGAEEEVGEDAVQSKSDSAKVRKVRAHPSTEIMVTEALTELDSRKGVSMQAISNFIKKKYPSVEEGRLKYHLHRTIIKGIETGTLVRPTNATVTTGVLGKFKLAPKLKKTKSKAKNVEPDVQKPPRATKEATSKKTGTTKKAIEKKPKSAEDSKPSKNAKDKVSTSKVAPAKKPKAAGAGDTKAVGDSKKRKATTKESKATTKESKAVKGKVKG